MYKTTNHHDHVTNHIKILTISRLAEDYYISSHSGALQKWHDFLKKLQQPPIHRFGYFLPYVSAQSCTLKVLSHQRTSNYQYLPLFLYFAASSIINVGWTSSIWNAMYFNICIVGTYCLLSRHILISTVAFLLWCQNSDKKTVRNWIFEFFLLITFIS